MLTHIIPYLLCHLYLLQAVGQYGNDLTVILSNPKYKRAFGHRARDLLEAKINRAFSRISALAMCKKSREAASSAPAPTTHIA